MTTANALGWRDRLPHASRTRLGDAAAALVRADTSRVGIVADRVVGANNERLSCWVSWPRGPGNGRARQECVLTAAADIQLPDRVVWRATLMPILANGAEVRVIGRVVWEPDLAPDPQEYRFDYLLGSDPAFTRPGGVTPSTQVQLAARSARQGGCAETHARTEELRRARLIDDHRLLVEDDHAGRVCGAGAMRVVLAAAAPVLVRPSWVREFLRRFEHFHLLDLTTRVGVYRAIGEFARVLAEQGREAADRAADPVVADLSQRLPLTAAAIESWLVERLVESGALAAADAGNATARTQAVTALLFQNTGVTPRLREGIGCYNRAVLREAAADARERLESQEDAEIMAAAEAAAPSAVVAGTPLVCVDGVMRVAVGGEPHQFVAQGPPDEDGRVMALGANGSGMLMPLGTTLSGARRSANLDVPPERVRGTRANTILVDEAVDVPTAAIEAIMRGFDQVDGVFFSTPRRELNADQDADVVRRRSRQQALAGELRRVVSQMFDPDLDTAGMTAEEAAVAALRYRLRVLLTAVPAGALSPAVGHEDVDALDVVFRAGIAGREVVRVRLDAPDVLDAAAVRVGAYAGADGAGLRVIDL